MSTPHRDPDQHHTPHFNPWALAHEWGLTVHYDHLNDARGYTDGIRTIWLDHRLTRTEARCSLTHELFHVVAGHYGHQPPTVEEQVRAMTARYLVPWPYLRRYWDSQVEVYDAADELAVTVDVLADRIRYAHPAEVAQLGHPPHTLPLPRTA